MFNQQNYKSKAVERVDISFGEYFRRLICLLFGFIEPFPLFYSNLLATFNHIFMGASFPQMFLRYIVWNPIIEFYTFLLLHDRFESIRANVVFNIG